MRTISRREHACSEGRGLAAVALGLAFAMLVPVTASGADPSPTPGQTDGGIWTDWWELGGFHGTDNASRSEVTVFAPWGRGDNARLFDDGKLFAEDVRESNFTLGDRQIMPSDRNFGIWGRRSTNTNNAFLQISDGLRYGVDGKIGLRLFGGNLPDGEAIFRPGEFWIYGGGFRFNGDGALSKVTGPNVRAEWRFDGVIEELPGSRLTLEGEFSNDRIRADKWEFGLRLRIPFGGPTEDWSRSYASL